MTLNLEKRALFVSRLLCALAASLAAIAFTGWLLDIPILTNLGPSFPAMQPNTIMGLLMIASTIFLSSYVSISLKLKFVIYLINTFVLLIGIITLGEYFFAWDMSFDQILMENIPSRFPFPGRPSPQTALNFTLLGVALILGKNNNLHSRLGQFAIIITVANSISAITGYVFSTSEFYGFPSIHAAIGMAIHTAISFVFLAVALLLSYGRQGIMSLVLSNTRSGWIVRRFMIVSIVAPPLIGLITRIGNSLGWYNLEIQVSLFALLLVAIFIWVLWITARRSEQEELRAHRLMKDISQTREQYETLVENASDAIFIADLNGKYTGVNQRVCELLGYQQEDIIGKKISDFIPPEDIPRLELSRKKTLTPGQVDITEWHFKKKDGEYLPIEVSSKILSDGRWLAIARDISERRAAQQALEASERKFRGLLETALDAVVVMDQRGCINFVNHQTLNWFGYQSDELLGRPIEILVPKGFRKKDKDTITASEELIIGEGLENCGRKKDGTLFPIDVSLSSSESPIGPVVTAFIRDISETKKRLTQTNFLAKIGSILSESIQYEETLKKTANIVVPELADICVIRLVDEDGVMNVAAMAHSTSEQKKEIESLSKLMDQSDLGRSWLKQLMDTHKSIMINDKPSEKINDIISFNFPFPDQFSELGINSLAIVPLINHGKCLGIMTVLMDRSNRKIENSDLNFFETVANRIALSIENAKLYQTAQLATKNREDVLAIVSHDLKSPLFAIRLAIQVLQTSEFENEIDDMTRRKLFVSIENSIGQMEKIIYDLLDFAKTQNGDLSMDREPEDVVDIVTGILSPIKIQVEAKHLNFEIDILKDLPSVFCDRYRIGQVLTNLLTNAIKFTPEGGTIGIHTSRVNGYVKISITDTGKGIPKEVLPKIFERFWQAKETRHMGSGLGLSIVKAIVNAHGGAVEVESELGVGSTFSFMLPVVDESRQWEDIQT